MKKCKLFLAVALVLTLGATSCKKEENGERLTSFYATCEEDLNAQVDIIQPPDHQLEPHKMKMHPNTLLSKKCLLCKLCWLCNGCKYARSVARYDKQHCEEMKKLEQRILAAGWSL